VTTASLPDLNRSSDIIIVESPPEARSAVSPSALWLITVAPVPPLLITVAPLLLVNVVPPPLVTVRLNEFETFMLPKSWIKTRGMEATPKLSKVIEMDTTNLCGNEVSSNFECIDSVFGLPGTSSDALHLVISPRQYARLPPPRHHLGVVQNVEAKDKAVRYALPGRDFHPLDSARFAWRTV